RRCDLMVTNDTGPRHIAAAMDVPVVTVFGPTHPEWTEIYYAKERQVAVKVFCGPCQKKTCPLDHRCMTRVTPGMVYEKAVELLGLGRQATAAATAQRSRDVAEAKAAALEELRHEHDALVAEGKAVRAEIDQGNQRVELLESELVRLAEAESTLDQVRAAAEGADELDEANRIHEDRTLQWHHDEDGSMVLQVRGAMSALRLQLLFSTTRTPSAPPLARSDVEHSSCT
ncbi:MAG: glycosyltransferase family 9 protein, partial [Actinobacteria bacterium]|nr:glycosyltransferase family 9 protein [Actinomycetota bacterium]